MAWIGGQVDGAGASGGGGLVGHGLDSPKRVCAGWGGGWASAGGALGGGCRRRRRSAPRRRRRWPRRAVGDDEDDGLERDDGDVLLHRLLAAELGVGRRELQLLGLLGEGDLVGPAAAGRTSRLLRRRDRNEIVSSGTTAWVSVSLPSLPSDRACALALARRRPGEGSSSATSLGLGRLGVGEGGRVLGEDVLGRRHHAGPVVRRHERRTVGEVTQRRDARPAMHRDRGGEL